MLSKKKCLDNLKQSNINFLWLRLFDVYGPLDNKNWLLPNFMQCYSKSVKIKLLNPNRYWNFIHIDDLVKIVFSTTKNNITGIYNLCSSENITLKNIIKIFNPKLHFIDYENRKENDFHLKGSNKKLLTKLKNFKFITMKNGIKNLYEKNYKFL